MPISAILRESWQETRLVDAVEISCGVCTLRAPAHREQRRFPRLRGGCVDDNLVLDFCWLSIPRFLLTLEVRNRPSSSRSELFHGSIASMTNRTVSCMPEKLERERNRRSQNARRAGISLRTSTSNDQRPWLGENEPVTTARIDVALGERGRETCMSWGVAARRRRTSFCAVPQGGQHRPATSRRYGVRGRWGLQSDQVLYLSTMDPLPTTDGRSLASLRSFTVQFQVLRVCLLSFGGALHPWGGGNGLSGDSTL